MPLEFIDTNVFIRYLTDDHPDHSALSLKFLQEIEAGNRTAAICEAVLVEIVQVLSSKALYGYPRQAIRESVSDLIGLRGLRLPHKRTYLRALDLYASTNVDFVDAICVSHMERSAIATIVSFDREFDHFQGITRREP
ncbi:MAG: PIN domain-containing protein [Dehalococcoidia bacterium]|nr:PIN domain-containing protein [Dehalococcoidia bacterium]